MTRREALKVLPPLKGESVLIVDDQDVNDIVDEVLAAHKFFAPDYNYLAPLFWTGNVYDTCEYLYNFCRDNIKYKAEGEADQTTKSPTAILTKGRGDCKHYAGFIGGVLDAINREYGAGIDWEYCFASYDDKKAPQHVFVIAWDNSGEIWIDPVLKTFDERLQPSSTILKKSSVMLNRISGVREQLYDLNFQTPRATIGWTVETSAGYTKSGERIYPKVGDLFYGDDWLGLTRYGAATNTDLAQLTRELQQLIDEDSPAPYQLSQSLVEKVLRDNVQYWNFFYPTGTSPNKRAWEDELSNWLMLKEVDGRLTFDRDAEPSHTDPKIHHLADWTNYLVQAYSPTPYIPLIDHMKRLGAGWKTPAEGSLWKVIHEGDKNYAKISEFVGEIPGLKELAAAVGLNLTSLMNSAGKFLTKRNGSNTTIPTPPTQTAGSSSSILPIALLAGAGLLLLNKPRRKVSGVEKSPLLWIGLGAAALLLLNKNQTGVWTPGSTNENPGTVPGTATPPYMQEKPQVLPMETKELAIEEDAPVYEIKKPVPINEPSDFDFSLEYYNE